MKIFEIYYSKNKDIEDIDETWGMTWSCPKCLKKATKKIRRTTNRYVMRDLGENSGYFCDFHGVGEAIFNAAIDIGTPLQE